MKAISLSQPWASLVVDGSKMMETRSWRTSFVGPVAVHASKKFLAGGKELVGRQPFRAYLEDYDVIPLGCILGVVWVEGCIETETVRRLLSRTELAFGDYSDGRWAWTLRNPLKLKEPIPYSGSLGLWDINNRSATAKLQALMGRWER